MNYADDRQRWISTEVRVGALPVITTDKRTCVGAGWGILPALILLYKGVNNG